MEGGHGGIDGHFQTIIYLHCATNNRADTVLHVFQEAVETSEWSVYLVVVVVVVQESSLTLHQL